MEVNSLKKEIEKLLKTLGNSEPGTDKYGTVLSDLKTLEGIDLEKKKLELNKLIESGKLDLEKEEKRRRFELEKKEKDRRYESEKRLTEAEVSAKLAEIELNKRKFEFEVTDRTRRFQEEIQENARRIKLDQEKFEHDKSIQLARQEIDAKVNLAIAMEKNALIARSSSKWSNVFLPITQVVVPVFGGLLGAGMTIKSEEFRIITSKGLNVMKQIMR